MRKSVSGVIILIISILLVLYIANTFWDAFNRKPTQNLPIESEQPSTSQQSGLIEDNTAQQQDPAAAEAPEGSQTPADYSDSGISGTIDEENNTDSGNPSQTAQENDTEDNTPDTMEQSRGDEGRPVTQNDAGNMPDSSPNVIPGSGNARVMTPDSPPAFSDGNARFPDPVSPQNQPSGAQTPAPATMPNASQPNQIISDFPEPVDLSGGQSKPAQRTPATPSAPAPAAGSSSSFPEPQSSFPAPQLNAPAPQNQPQPANSVFPDPL